MRAAALFVGLACVGFVGSLASACGSSSGGSCTSSCVPGCPCPNGDASGPPRDASKDNSARDTGPRPVDVNRTEDAEAAAPETGGCTGLDATASELGLSAACESCVSTNCCMQFEACKGNAACVAIETCTGECIVGGGSVSTCATGCIADSGSASGVSAADALDGCIVGSCSTPCGAP